jgi:hypothetical protein
MPAVVRPHPRTALADAVGVYLTDEVFLFRVVDLMLGGGDGMIELEDCFRLDRVRVPLTSVRARRLRIVLPGSPEPFSGAA